MIMEQEKDRIDVHESDWYGGDRWYWWLDEYPEEGSCGPFASRGDAITNAGFDVETVK